MLYYITWYLIIGIIWSEAINFQRTRVLRLTKEGLTRREYGIIVGIWALLVPVAILKILYRNISK